MSKEDMFDMDDEPAPEKIVKRENKKTYPRVVFTIDKYRLVQLDLDTLCVEKRECNSMKENYFVSVQNFSKHSSDISNAIIFDLIEALDK